MTPLPRIIAHRGAKSLAPENTIAAFAKAMEVGARWFEFDVGAIGDGSLIVMHDDTLDRTTTGSGRYDGLAFSDIRKLDAGRWFSGTYRFERVPEAADAIEFGNTAQMGMHLEVKPCRRNPLLRERLVEALAVAVGAAADPAHFVVSSFDHDLLAAFHEARPDVALGWLVERGQGPSSWRGGAEALGCAAVHPPLEGLTEAEVADIRAAGFDVNVWTVNDVECAQRLAQWGVTGVFTDVPQDFPADALARL